MWRKLARSRADQQNAAVARGDVTVDELANEPILMTVDIEASWTPGTAVQVTQVLNRIEGFLRDLTSARITWSGTVAGRPFDTVDGLRPALELAMRGD